MLVGSRDVIYFPAELAEPDVCFMGLLPDFEVICESLFDLDKAARYLQCACLRHFPLFPTASPAASEQPCRPGHHDTCANHGRLHG